MKLNILDQSPVTDGETPRQAIENTLELAQKADQLGYHRFWVSEHHNTVSFASPTPEILIPRLASLTSRMRIGSGGVMLGHYSPFKVAEQFNMLENLFPGRIDLGLGRASGADAETTRVLEAGVFHNTDPFQKMLELISIIGKSNNPFQYGNVNAMPLTDSKPEFWILGSSPASALFAAKHGLAYSFASFINDDACIPSLQMYHQNFTPSPHLSAPYVNLGIFALCASTEEKARALVKSSELWGIRAFIRGDYRPFPKNEEAIRATFHPQETMFLNHRRASRYIGSPEQIKTQLDGLVKRLMVDELTIVTITDQLEDRLESYRLIAEIYGLEN